MEVLGFDYYNTKTGTIESGGNEKIAIWLLDTDYDGRSLFPKQVFFPMAGESEGWAKLAKNLKAGRRKGSGVFIPTNYVSTPSLVAFSRALRLS